MKQYNLGSALRPIFFISLILNEVAVPCIVEVAIWIATHCSHRILLPVNQKETLKIILAMNFSAIKNALRS